MAVHVVGGALMTSDQSEHQAKSVGDSCWVVSYLPGRTLTMQQATAAMQAAEAVAVVGMMADLVGLTALETVGLALQEPPWETSLRESTRNRWRWRTGGRR